MQKLENIPSEEMPEVVSIASRLYQADQDLQEEAQERQATIAAAEEAGLPEEYLHRAALEHHARKVEREFDVRRKRGAILAVVGAAVVLGGIGFVLSSIPTPPLTTPTPPITGAQTSIPSAFTPEMWRLKVNKETQAKFAFSNGIARISIQRFGLNANGKHSANFNTFDAPKNLSSFRSTAFRLNGTLPNVRLYFENGNERWRSPMIRVERQERTIQLKFDQFERQVRANKNASWRKEGYQSPKTVENASFKLGWYVNDANASGEVFLSDLQFQ